MALQIQNETIKQFGTLCYNKGYQINKEIGSGSYGKVYSATTIRDIKNEDGVFIVKRRVKCAIKLAVIKQGCEKVY